MTNELTFLNRFTTIPFLIDLIVRRRLTLLNPESWEDYNDRVTMELYKTKKGSKSIYALCMTTKRETIHHWNAFANGTSGCCVEFNFGEFISIVSKNKELSHGKTNYIKIGNLSSLTEDIENLPYLKRQPFEPEQEYRIVIINNETQKISLDIPIELSCIKRITFNNKLPESVFQSIKEILIKIEPSLKNKISHSTLYNNATWTNYFEKQNGS